MALTNSLVTTAPSLKDPESTSTASPLRKASRDLSPFWLSTTRIPLPLQSLPVPYPPNAMSRPQSSISSLRTLPTSPPPLPRSFLLPSLPTPLQSKPTLIRTPTTTMSLMSSLAVWMKSLAVPAPLLLLRTATTFSPPFLITPSPLLLTLPAASMRTCPTTTTSSRRRPESDTLRDPLVRLSIWSTDGELFIRLPRRTRTRTSRSFLLVRLLRSLASPRNPSMITCSS
mmetsp:Transcript_29121/g.40901  ORF Transcript_29121/g.40901 Transcript_29121/m.40901 type:complete len:228 (-) Transcript_29121:50-733(-)